MITPNMHYRDLKESYLFAGIAQKVKEYQMEHPEKHIYRMGSVMYLCLFVMQLLRHFTRA